MNLRILIVDDETMARAHMRRLIERCALPTPPVIAEAAQASDALKQLAQRPADLLLLDIGMSDGDGVELARQLRGQPDAPAVVFVTGHSSHAVAAFELDAVDYLTKPVGVDRLQQALHKTVRHLQGRHVQAAADDALLIQARGRSERVPLDDVLYLKSEDKYLTVRTATHEHLFEGSLSALERAHPERFVRAHRNALVARSAIRALVREGDDGTSWALRIEGIAEQVAVSRRQLAGVRQALKEK